MPAQRFVYTLLVAGALCLSGGCTSRLANRFYTPNRMQIPMLTEQHDAAVSANVGTSFSSEYKNWEVQALYSPLPHVGLMFNHSYVRHSGLVTTDFSPFFMQTTYQGRSRFSEGGIGGYYSLGPQKEYLVSLFGGYGQGHVLNQFQPDISAGGDTYDAEWNYGRWFLQPAVGIRRKGLQVGTGLRFVWVKYFDGNINGRVGLLETDRIHLLEANNPLFLTELAWSIGYYFRPVVITLNSTAIVRGKNAVRDLDLASNYISLGIGFELHELWKKKKPKK